MFGYTNIIIVVLEILNIPYLLVFVGVIHGTAAIDSCGVCSGGNTGFIPNATRDCAGFCSGPFTFTGQQCMCKRIYQCEQWPALHSFTPNILETQYIWIQEPYQSPVPSTSNAVNFFAAGLSSAVRIPFNFSFFNQSVSNFYVSAYGGLFFDNDSSSQCLRYLFNAANFSSQLCGMRCVAGFLSENTAYGAAFIYSSPTQICVNFTNILTNGTFYMVNLITCLNYGGGITLIYGQLYQSLHYHRRLASNFDTFVIGLRNGWSPLSLTYVDTATGDYLPNNVASRQYWLSIPSNLISSYQQFEFCLISKDACMYPFAVTPQGGQAISLYLQGISCLADASNLKCRFGVKTSNATVHVESGTVVCVAPPGLNDTLVLFDLLLQGSVIPFRTQLTLRYIDNTVPSFNDFCDTCHEFTNECGSLDCTNTWNGTAYLDGISFMQIQLKTL